MSTEQQAPQNFDPFEKERALRAESASWDTSNVKEAQDGDIPLIDLASYLLSPSDENVFEAAQQLKAACEQVGFFSIIGHQISTTQIANAFKAARQFHAQPLHEKLKLKMDRTDWPLSGVGYLPVKHRKLPSRGKGGNLNEAFIVKCDHNIKMVDNQWPVDSAIPAFRQTVEAYAQLMTELGRKLMPLFALALDMPKNFFDEAFEKPLFRLRMTHYPSIGNAKEDDFGIAPHVDTTFCTILAQDQPGLTIYSEHRQEWISVPLIPDAFIVNTGELLRQWTNDRFISVKHFANNNIGNTSRYSIPFFLNAHSDYVMSCVPSCYSSDNPVKYSPISYNQSQAVAQGE